MRKVILTGSDGFIGSSFKKTLSKTWDIVEVEKHNCWSFLLTFRDKCLIVTGKPSDPVRITFLILL